MQEYLSHLWAMTLMEHGVPVPQDWRGAFQSCVKLRTCVASKYGEEYLCVRQLQWHKNFISYSFMKKSKRVKSGESADQVTGPLCPIHLPG
jgi:hypothetical protein